MWGTNLVDKETVDVRSELRKSPVCLFMPLAHIKVNLVIFSQKRLMSEFQVNSWRNPLREIYPDLPIYEVLNHFASLTNQMLLPQNWMYIMLNFEVNRRIRANLPKDEWKNVIYISGGSNLNLKPSSLGIDIENSYLAYPFLVDDHGKFWWRAGGKATPKDLIALCLLKDHLAGSEPTPAKVYEKVLSEILHKKESVH